MKRAWSVTTIRACALLVGMFIAAGAAAQPGPAGPRINLGGGPVDLVLGYEQGFVAVLDHAIQFDQDGTRFDYVADGGQDVLFPIRRFTADIDIRGPHSVVLLYQPIDIRTVDTVDSDLVVNDGTFSAGTTVAFRYGFDFYRVSWLYDFARDPGRELAAGISFQIRNAVIAFQALDGSLLRVTRDVGPVPILKLRGRVPVGRRLWAGAEVDGFYADGRYITGTGNDFVGAILDASLRVGAELSPAASGYLNLRYIGGGARGIDESYPGHGDGYTDNWLHTLGVALGLTLR